LNVAQWPAPSAASVVNVVVVTGDPSPDGNGSFAEFGAPGIQPSLNDAGQVVFLAKLTNTIGGAEDAYGIFRGDGATIDQIVRGKQPAPDGNGDFGINPFAFLRPMSINDSGQVLFAVKNLYPTMGGEADDSGLFFGDGATLIQLVREGQPWPDGAGQFQNITGVHNNAGQVALLTEFGTGFGRQHRIFRTDGTMLVQIVSGAALNTGQDAPDGNGTFGLTGVPTINDAGQVAFPAGLNGTSGGESDNEGIFRGDGSTIVQIVRENQAAPDGNGRYAGSPDPAARLNDLGQTAFMALFRNTMGGTSDDTGILRGDGTSLVTIVRAGQMAPDGNGAFSNFTRFGGERLAYVLNNVGQVAFEGFLIGTADGTSDNTGIFRSDGVSLVQLVRAGGTAPDGNGRFASFGDPALNDAGQVAFRAGLTGTSGGGISDNTGIFFFDDTLGLQQVARTGDVFLGSTIAFLDFASIDQLGEEFSGLNESGVPRVAYFFRLGDSREGIAIWSPIPESSSAILLTVGVLGARRSRLRRHACGRK
jgi:hypothetical protein